MLSITEKNYYSGKDSDGHYRVLQVQPFQIPAPPNITGLLNGTLVSVGISHRLKFLQQQIDEVIHHYEDRRVLPYRYTLEAALISMKRTLDDLIMSSYCMLHKDEINATKRLQIDSFGALFKNGKPTKTGKIVLEYFLVPMDGFAETLTEIVNSYKHSYLLPEAQRVWGADFPTIVSIYAHRNDYSGDVFYHNHSLGQILRGFNKTVEQIIARQKQFMAGSNAM